MMDTQKVESVGMPETKKQEHFYQKRNLSIDQFEVFFSLPSSRLRIIIRHRVHKKKYVTPHRINFTFMIKHFSFLLCFFVIISAATAQDSEGYSSSAEGESALGLGLGLPYGGIGGRFGYNVVDNLNVFLGFGFSSISMASSKGFTGFLIKLWVLSI